MRMSASEKRRERQDIVRSRPPRWVRWRSASGHGCEFDRRRTNFCFECGMLPFELICRNEQVAPIADVHHARAAFDFLPAPSLPKDDQELPARGEVRPPRAVGALVATSEMWNVAEIGPVCAASRRTLEVIVLRTGHGIAGAAIRRFSHFAPRRPDHVTSVLPVPQPFPRSRPGAGARREQRNPAGTRATSPLHARQWRVSSGWPKRDADISSYRKIAASRTVA